MKIKWIDESRGVAVEKFMSIEMVAVKSCKSLVYSGWNEWQNIIIEIEYADTGMDKADENSQYLETYYAMRKTMESEREAKDPITEQMNKYTRNGGRRYQEPSEISKIDPSTDPKVEEMLSVKMQVKSGDGIVAARKTFAETTQLLENVLEKSSKSSIPDVQSTQNQTPDVKEGASSQRRARSAGEAPGAQRKEREEGERRIEEFAARFNRLDAAVQLATGHKISGEAKNAEAAKSGLAKPHDVENSAYL